jgi:hypothetical protein
MLKRVMVGLIVMSAAASMSFDDAEAGCALIAGKRMCAAWIKGSAKCLASIDDTSFGVGSCEVGGTEFGGHQAQAEMRSYRRFHRSARLLDRWRDLL